MENHSDAVLQTLPRSKTGTGKGDVTIRVQGPRNVRTYSSGLGVVTEIYRFDEI